MGRGQAEIETGGLPERAERFRSEELEFRWEEAANHEEALVAYLDGEEVGAITIGGGRISGIDVSEGYRRRGLATLLLAEAEKEWGELEHGLLTDDGKAWLQSIYPQAHFERSPEDADYWEVRF